MSKLKSQGNSQVQVVSSKIETSILLVLVVILAAIVMGWSTIKPTFGAAPSGLPGTIATSSALNISAGGTITLVATSSTCSSRVITTNAASAIMLTFSDYIGQSPSGSFGVWQAASTTVAYDSGLYGCGLVKAFSYAAQSLTVTDVR